jgi:transcription factor CON7
MAQPPHMVKGQYPGHPVGSVPQGPPPPNQQRPGQVSQETSLIGGGQALTTPQQVYSIVPIPGPQQHKRPRRRYEEIERMYKCGWNGCEKAYGTLNHLNAHVTWQRHGSKRTPEGMLPYIILRYVVAGEQLDGLRCDVTCVGLFNRPAVASN